MEEILYTQEVFNGSDYDVLYPKTVVEQVQGAVASTEKGAANGVATLDNSGKVAALQISNKQNVPTYTTSTMTATNWSGSTYSFEAQYPNASYDISISVAPTATSNQFDAFGSAKICGSATTNVVTALGTVPSVNIPIIIKAVAK